MLGIIKATRYEEYKWGRMYEKNIEWINQARGIGMFLVVFGHAMHDSFIRGGVHNNVINLKRLLNGKQNVWKYQNGEEKSDSDGREKDV